MKTQYFIQNIHNENLFWSNDFGWIDISEDGFEEMPIFMTNDPSLFDLPVNGQWKEE